MSYFYSILAQINNSTPDISSPWDTYSCPVGQWRSIACNGTNKFVAIAWGSTSEYTKVMYSTDAMTWTLLPTELYLQGLYIAFNNGKFAIYGSHYNPDSGRTDRVVFISSDGITWTSKIVNFVQDSTKLCSANGRFFILPDRYGDFCTSTDGITWTANSIPSSFSNEMYASDITYFNGKYLLLGAYGLCAYSTGDFNVWTRFNMIQSNSWNIIEKVASNKVIALSSDTDTAQSLDGISNWTYKTQSNANFEFGEFATSMPGYPSGYFVGGNPNEILHSADGLTNYISIPKDARLEVLTDICHSNDKFVVIGANKSGVTEQVVHVFKTA